MSNITSATVTAKTGPAQQVTSLVLSNQSSFSVDVGRQILRIFPDGGGTIPGSKEFDLTGVTTFTVSISSGNFTLTIS